MTEKEVDYLIDQKIYANSVGAITAPELNSALKAINDKKGAEQRGTTSVNLNASSGVLTVTIQAIDPTVSDASAVAVDRTLLRNVKAILSNGSPATLAECVVANGTNAGEITITAPSSKPLVVGTNTIDLYGSYCGVAFVQTYSVTGVAEGSTTASAAITLNIIGSTPADGGEIEPMLYADLVAKRNAGELHPGAMYRITNFVTTVANTENARSAGHAFDIVVTAIDESNLTEEAYAVMHDGDTYFAKANMSAWKIWYSLDNDATRFAWADTVNGKGVIYRMIDEWGNDCPFDFKNVQFKRYKITTCAHSASLVGQYGIKGIGAYAVDDTVVYWSHAFCMQDLNDNLPHDVSLEQDVYISDEGVYCRTHDNAFAPCYDNVQVGEGGTIQMMVLPNSVFVTDTDLCSMERDEESGEYTYGEFYGCYANTFGNNCNSNTFGNNCNSNTFGNNCSSNTFGDGCYANTLGNSCSSNTFGDGCSSNTFGNNCNSNTFGDGCNSNTFGDGCSSNTFGDGCNSNTFGDGCSSNTFGDGCYANTIGNGCYANILGNNCNFYTFGSDVQYISVTNGGGESPLQCAQILSGTRGTDGEHVLAIQFVTGASYSQFAGLNSSGVLKVWTPADAVA